MAALPGTCATSAPVTLPVDRVNIEHGRCTRESLKILGVSPVANPRRRDDARTLHSSAVMGGDGKSRGMRENESDVSFVGTALWLTTEWFVHAKLRPAAYF